VTTNGAPIIGPCTLKALLLQFYDITSPIRKQMLKMLAFYATDPNEKLELDKLSSEDPNKQEYYNEEIVNKSRTILEVLKMYPSSRPPLDHFLELLPRLQTRFYSIASSPKVHKDSIHICAVVVEWTTPTGRPAKGVATNYLKDLIPTDTFQPRVPVFVRRNPYFKLPSKLETPIIMVGPGTGFAPFRGFIEERNHSLIEKGPTESKSILFFGCRDPDKDFLYKDEIEFYGKNNIIELYTAFSRISEKKNIRTTQNGRRRDCRKNMEPFSER